MRVRKSRKMKDSNAYADSAKNPRCEHPGLSCKAFWFSFTWRLDATAHALLTAILVGEIAAEEIPSVMASAAGETELPHGATAVPAENVEVSNS